MAQFAKTLTERIKSRVRLSKNDCWEWQGYLTPTGYGQLSVGSRTDDSRVTVHAHRASYEAFVGKLIDGMHIDHLCKNRACVNPAHLEQVTPKENIHRSDAVYKKAHLITECPKGHKYTESNTYFRTTRAGGVGRQCKTCSKESSYKGFLKRREMRLAA